MSGWSTATTVWLSGATHGGMGRHEWPGATHWAGAGGWGVVSCFASPAGRRFQCNGREDMPLGGRSTAERQMDDGASGEKDRARQDAKLRYSVVFLVSDHLLRWTREGPPRSYIDILYISTAPGENTQLPRHGCFTKCEPKEAALVSTPKPTPWTGRGAELGAQRATGTSPRTIRLVRRLASRTNTCRQRHADAVLARSIRTNTSSYRPPLDGRVTPACNATPPRVTRRRPFVASPSSP